MCLCELDRFGYMRGLTDVDVVCRQTAQFTPFSEGREARGNGL
jgi:hypothetical protein